MDLITDLINLPRFDILDQMFKLMFLLLFGDVYTTELTILCYGSPLCTHESWVYLTLHQQESSIFSPLIQILWSHDQY